MSIIPHYECANMPEDWYCEKDPENNNFKSRKNDDGTDRTQWFTDKYTQIINPCNYCYGNSNDKKEDIIKQPVPALELTKSEARELTHQLGGKTNKSTKIMYGGEKAKIIGLDKSKNLLIQTNNALHRVNTNNVKINNKYVL